jgi:hypothetical protein
MPLETTRSAVFSYPLLAISPITFSVLVTDPILTGADNVDSGPSTDSLGSQFLARAIVAVGFDISPKLVISPLGDELPAYRLARVQTTSSCDIDGLHSLEFPCGSLAQNPVVVDL